MSTYFSISLKFSRRIGAMFGMLSRRAGLSATAELSCLACLSYQFLPSYLS